MSVDPWCVLILDIFKSGWFKQRDQIYLASPFTSTSWPNCCAGHQRKTLYSLTPSPLHCVLYPTLLYSKVCNVLYCTFVHRTGHDFTFSYVCTLLQCTLYNTIKCVQYCSLLSHIYCLLFCIVHFPKVCTVLYLTLSYRLYFTAVYTSLKCAVHCTLLYHIVCTLLNCTLPHCTIHTYFFSQPSFLQNLPYFLYFLVGWDGCSWYPDVWICNYIIQSNQSFNILV